MASILCRPWGRSVGPPPTHTVGVWSLTHGLHSGTSGAPSGLLGNTAWSAPFCKRTSVQKVCLAAPHPALLCSASLTFFVFLTASLWVSSVLSSAGPQHPSFGMWDKDVCPSYYWSPLCITAVHPFLAVHLPAIFALFINSWGLVFPHQPGNWVHLHAEGKACISFPSSQVPRHPLLQMPKRNEPFTLEVVDNFLENFFLESLLAPWWLLFYFKYMYH